MSDLIDREYAIKRFCEDGTYLERHGVQMMTLCEAKQRAVDLIESFPLAQPVNYGSTKTDSSSQLKLNNDLISRQDAIDAHCELCPDQYICCPVHNGNICPDFEVFRLLPSANPTYTDEEIQRMQDLQSAEIEKAYQLGYEEGEAHE